MSLPYTIVDVCVDEVFSQVTFEPDSRQHYLKLLGYDPTELAKKVNHHGHYNCMVK